MSDNTEFMVGQKLWFVPNRGSASEVTITKIGRKWIYITGEYWFYGDYLVDKDTLAVIHRGEGVGDCFLSREDYEQAIENEIAWSKLTKLTYGSYRRPKHLSANDINEIIAKINGDA